MPTESLPAVFAFAFIFSFGAVVSPGPVSAAILSESPRHGWRVGPLIAGGHSALELVVVILISLGLSAGMASPQIRAVIGLGGGAVLLFIGVSYIIGSLRGRIRLPDATESTKPASNLSLFGIGLVTTLSNPFWYAWWVTVAAGYLAQARALGTATVAVFYLGHISADFSWDTLLSTMASAGRRWLTPKRYQALILVTGGFMIYLGILFIRSSLA